MWRTVVSVIAGFVASGLVVFAVGSLGDALFPVVASETMDLDQMMASIPFGGQVFMVLSWALASLAAGTMAAYMAEEHTVKHALAVGLVLQVMALVRIAVFPHPTWMVVAVFVVFLPMAWVGAKLGDRLLAQEEAAKGS